VETRAVHTVGTHAPMLKIDDAYIASPTPEAISTAASTLNCRMPYRKLNGR
jgi:hypothetical protein